MWWPPLPAFSFVLCPDCLSYSFLVSAFICPVCFFSLLSSEGSHIHVFTEPRGNNTCFVRAVFTPVPSLYLVKYQEGLAWKLCPFSRAWLHINNPRLTLFIRQHKSILIPEQLSLFLLRLCSNTLRSWETLCTGVCRRQKDWCVPEGFTTDCISHNDLCCLGWRLHVFFVPTMLVVVPGSPFSAATDAWSAWSHIGVPAWLLCWYISELCWGWWSHAHTSTYKWTILK